MTWAPGTGETTPFSTFCTVPWTLTLPPSRVTFTVAVAPARSMRPAEWPRLVPLEAETLTGPTVIPLIV
jgi:hypothetical protein